MAFLPGKQYVGRDLYEVFPEVYERSGNKVAISGCGVGA